MPELHTFHIPVLGLGYSVDTPIKVARFGISSVVSIMDDELLEQMRQFHCSKLQMPYMYIDKYSEDSRARRITEYLDTVQYIVAAQMVYLRGLPLTEENDLTKYFELLPGNSELKSQFQELKALSPGKHREKLEQELRDAVTPGDIDVNIMVKVDKVNKDKTGQSLPSEYSDALSALRGFANSKLTSSVILSAGYNPRLYTYIENFPDFFPDEEGQLKKKVIIKVSDYRSALVQGKILAKKGVWVSEFRIESGLNCGGHAFATDGLLLGPILEEFKNKYPDLARELYQLCREAQNRKNIPAFNNIPQLKIAVQGGIGTESEQNLLLDYYRVSRTGWGSPFLLVPEATNVDQSTLQQLATADPGDYYLSDASPLGVPFNNFRKSTAEQQRVERAKKGRPGSPCYKKFLVSNTEFTEEPICTASRQYQHMKIKQLQAQHLPTGLYDAEYNKIIAKDCLCEGLTAPVLLKKNIPDVHRLKAVTICPGPNLAYFSGVFSLKDMVDHIYGKKDILNSLPRPHMFINELNLYIDYLKKALKDLNLDVKQEKYFSAFKKNLFAGIEYYKKLSQTLLLSMHDELLRAEEKLQHILIPAITYKKPDLPSSSSPF